MPYDNSLYNFCNFYMNLKLHPKIKAKQDKRTRGRAGVGAQNERDWKQCESCHGHLSTRGMTCGSVFSVFQTQHVIVQLESQLVSIRTHPILSDKLSRSYQCQFLGFENVLSIMTYNHVRCYHGGITEWGAHGTTCTLLCSSLWI